MTLIQVSHVLKDFIQEFSKDLHTAIPAIIEKFDPKTSEASVTPFALYKKPSSNTSNQEQIPYPTIHNVPVFFPQGLLQSASIIYPINKGDECLLIFSEQTLENWQTKAQSDTDLRHDISNALCIVGLFSKPNPLIFRSFDNESIILKRNDTYVEIFDGKLDFLVRHKDP